MAFKTEQEEFWAGDFGDQYVNRNLGTDYIESNRIFFSKALAKTSPLKSIIEFGPNIGMNLMALHYVMPETELNAVEINERAVDELKKWGKIKEIFHGSITDYESIKKFDLTFIKGVLIHLNPEVLSRAYDVLYNSSSKYILIAEYFNPTPIEIKYRGHEGKLFKRDFAGEILDRFKNLKLIDYGFVYRRDPNYRRQVSEFFDDVNWFLFEKTSSTEV